MLVSNACVNDTRVIRAAEAVAEQGFDMVVLALSDDSQTSEEWRNGVLYKRLGRPWLTVPALPALNGAQPRASTLARMRQYLANRALAAPILSALADRLRILLTPLRRSPNPKARNVYRGHGPHSHYRLKRLVAAFDKIVTIRERPLRRAPGAAFRLARGISIRLTSLARAPLRNFTILLRPLVDARRMRRMFEADLIGLKPDIVHAHDLVMLPAGAAAAKSVGAKLIYDAHELEVHRNTKTGIIDKWLRYRIERKHIKKCDAVVTVCESIADHLAREYQIKRPIVVMNAPDLEQEVHCNSDLRSTLALSRDIPLAVYVGRITVGRGIEQIVDALQYLPEYHLALVGPVNKPTVEAAHEAAQALGIAGRVHVVDPVSPQMIVSFISSGDVSVVPIQNVCLSYYYCLPNKLLESAMACLPVVVSNFPELRRFVELSGNGLVMDETDPLDIARAIREAYDNRDRLRPGPEGLRRVSEIYGWPRQKDALWALYSSFDPLPNQAPFRAITPSSNSKTFAFGHRRPLGLSN